MNRLALLLLLLGASSALAAPAPAPSGPAPAAPGAAPIPVVIPPGMGDLVANALDKEGVGEWVEYALYDKGKVDYAATIRLSLLPNDDPKLSPWLEVWMGKTGGISLRVRKSREGGPAEMYLKMGAAIYSVEDRYTQDQLTCEGGRCGQKEPGKGDPFKLTKETITTVAGTFPTDHIHRMTEKGPLDIWRSEKVPLLQVVRLLQPDKQGWELVAFGKQATSAYPKRFHAVPIPLQNLSTLQALQPKRVLPEAPDGGVPAAAPPCDPTKATCGPDGGVR